MNYCKRCGLEIGSYVSTYPFCPSCQPRLTVGLRETEQSQKTISKQFNIHTEMPWESGIDGGSIISKNKEAMKRQYEEGNSPVFEYYGGAVVCETVSKSDQEFIIHATKHFYADVEVKIQGVIEEITQNNEILPCTENQVALQMLEAALFWLNERTRKRKEQQVEGTNKPHHS